MIYSVSFNSFGKGKYKIIIYRKNYMQMTIIFSFSFNYVVKLSLYNMIHLQHGPFLCIPNIVL